MTPCAHEDCCRRFARCGGSGKTTVTLNLAIAATLKRKRVVVIDLDPQSSATRWSRLREGDTPVIVPGHGPPAPQPERPTRPRPMSLIRLVHRCGPKSAVGGVDALLIRGLGLRSHLELVDLAEGLAQGFGPLLGEVAEVLVVGSDPLFAAHVETVTLVDQEIDRHTDRKVRAQRGIE